MSNWYVYIAKSRTNRFYTGITTDPERRIKIHNLGEGAKFAIHHGPLRLIYVSRSFSNKSEARKREIQIKDWSQEKKLKLIEGIWH